MAIFFWFFGSTSEGFSLFSEIYGCSPTFRLLIDSTVIFLLKFLKYVLEENTFRTAKPFHSLKKPSICSLIPLLASLTHFAGNPGEGKLIKFWKFNEGVRHISMSKTHTPEATQTRVWVCLKSSATYFWGKMQAEPFAYVRAPIQHGRGRVRCCKLILCLNSMENFQNADLEEAGSGSKRHVM